ncbi:unnamed protein product (macronuclear) [Paramecium tetraurelia]|uniref:Transmembrane protein n=1 Tax=Paramecium tetraurelia TaxID=5888 RepID=A0CJ88_PARTE|nr:uncharacterized protein GSPATT00038637001 [Paramecium tetraurelia]CAK70855.1 unnamed protein product [Paramecium tetraurelia]|eukprot:XP_001438252.1 hypothetical protein (macronuclear) [Paramecium tetraurelia strain d4-2]
MGKLNGGCQQTPNLCEEILQDQFCEFTYNKERCIWVKGVCESLECKKLKLPTYNNHKACQKESSYCTFNLNSLGCTEYLCENVLEIEDCTIDSNGQIRTQNQGCIEKKCMTAHPTLDNNSKCEGWMPKCTVNVQVLSNQKILIGCVDKRSICELAVQEQCQSTLSEHMCKWNGSSQKCINQLCQDASPCLYLTNEDCKQFKVLSGPCIIGPSGVGCYQWPTNCTEIKSQQQCQLNIQNGTKCFWTGTYLQLYRLIILLQAIRMSDALKLYYTNNVQCNNWSSNCIFDHSLGGCIDRINQVACSSSLNVVMYNNHVECYARNQNCTVVSDFNPEGCERKKETCYEYIKRRNCKTTLIGQLCYWDDQEQKCMNEDEDNNGVVDCHKRLYGELTHQDCEDFMSKYTLNQIAFSCRTLSDYCDYKYQQQCIINSYQQPCKWNDLKQICEDVVNQNNTTSQTESECLMFRQNNECQLKINSDGTYGPGCENRPKSCQEITDPVICKLTLTTQNEKCYFHSSFCMVIQFRYTQHSIISKYCEQITESQSHEFCQLYNPNCVLQSSGQGCYSIYERGDLTKVILDAAFCRDVFVIFNVLIKYMLTIVSGKHFLNNNVNQRGIVFIVKTFELQSKNTTFDGLKQCNDISKSLIYNTECHCCQLIFSCDFAPQSLCNQSTDYFGKQCQYNQQSNVCGYRECEQLTSDQGISELICYQWKSECVLGATSCISYNNDCTKIGLIQQCYSYSCYWQDGKCVSYVNCGLNTTAITNRECLLSNSTFCRFNYTKGLGCAFISCDQIKNEAICSSSKVAKGVKCQWVSSQCTPMECYDYIIQSDCETSYGFYPQNARKCYWCSINSPQCTQNAYCNLSMMTSPKSHQDCYSNDVLQTINFIINPKCIVKQQQCSDYKYQEACVSTIDGIVCYCCGLINNHLYTFIIHSWKDSYMSLDNLGCQPLDCSQLTILSDCSIFTTNCFWDGQNCQIIMECNKYSNGTLCLNTSNSQGIPCFWDGTKCIEKTCSNKPTPSISQAECNSWLINCQYNSNNNRCLEDCTQADISNKTHQLCGSYYLNKSCTVKLDIIQCVDLPIACSFAKKTQCYKDQSGNECFYQESQNKCVNLTCSILQFTTHEKCNQKLNSCTVNSTLDGCQQLNVCGSYSIKEQCQIDSNNVECQWMMNQNKCTIKEGSTAQLLIYSVHNCDQYFGKSCTVNENLDECMTGQSLCMNYSYHQCKSQGQMNLGGVECFWNDEKNICLERICENGPSLAKTNSDCIGFLSTCQIGGCRIKDCFDYNYTIDSACASIFKSKKCVTNGYQCVFRMACEDVSVIDGCTFDINLNPCVWIDEKCYTKSCKTASNSLIKHYECNAYFPTCTVKQGGGCANKQICQNYQIKEACKIDSENGECIWDDYLNQCFSNQCMDFCGDGIVSSIEEESDDGNYLPYDGCYKCQVQCPQGCNICTGLICEDCQKKGWLLINGQCISICGDGHTAGKEFCDDGNDIEFDGCYQCSQSCHQKCLNCFQGLCLQCENGYIEDGSQCHNICGDGVLIEPLEKCDDGNSKDNDGCSDTCQVEQNWKCQQENNINCTNQTQKTNNDYEEFLLQFSEHVRLNVNNISEEQFLQMIIVVIENAKDNQYDVEIKPLISISSILTEVSYKILVYFKIKISNPVLKVTVRCENIVNDKDNTLLSDEIKLELPTPNKMSNDGQSFISKTALLSRIVMYTILIISGIAFLAGNLEIIWYLLDMLQQLSYMKFYNLQFPENLQIYFEIFNIGQLTPITNTIQINVLLKSVFDFQIPIIPAKQKFAQYQINCYFLDNLQSIVALIIIGFVYYYLSYYFYKFIVLFQQQKWAGIFYQSESKIIIKIVRLIFQFQKLARKYYQYFIYSGLIRIFTSNFYELAFASILQIVNYNTETSINATISLIALIKMQVNLFLIVFFFYSLNKKDIVPQKLSALVEGINNTVQQGTKQYFTILLIKKTLFIINLVVFQDLFAVQSIITACLSRVFSCYIYIHKPFWSNFENMKIFFTEIMIMINAIIFSIYDIIKFNSNKDSADVLGWINVSGFTIILIVTLAIDIYQQLNKYIS